MPGAELAGAVCEESDCTAIAVAVLAVLVLLVLASALFVVLVGWALAIELRRRQVRAPRILGALGAVALLAVLFVVSLVIPVIPIGPAGWLGAVVWAVVVVARGRRTAPGSD